MRSTLPLLLLLACDPAPADPPIDSATLSGLCEGIDSALAEAANPETLDHDGRWVCRSWHPFGVRDTRDNGDTFILDETIRRAQASSGLLVFDGAEIFNPLGLHECPPYTPFPIAYGFQLLPFGVGAQGANDVLWADVTWLRDTSTQYIAFVVYSAPYTFDIPVEWWGGWGPDFELQAWNADRQTLVRAFGLSQQDLYGSLRLGHVTANYQVFHHSLSIVGTGDRLMVGMDWADRGTRGSGGTGAPLMGWTSGASDFPEPDALYWSSSISAARQERPRSEQCEGADLALVGGALMLDYVTL